MKVPMDLKFDYFQSVDKTAIRYCCHPAAEPTNRVLLLNGRGEYMEKYREVITELNRRGCNVYTLDWRGQGLSGRLLRDRRKGHVADFNDYIEDLSVFVESVVAAQEKRPLVILAHSLGGHLALRYMHDYPDRVSRAVLVAPMIDINTFPIPKTVLRTTVQLVTGAGLATAYAPGSAKADPLNKAFEGNRLTADRTRFQREQHLLHQNPDLVVGGVTYGWLKSAQDSIDRMNRAGFARQIRVPVLMVSAAEDRIVCNRAQQAFCARLPQGRMQTLVGARHEILMETDSIRRRFWRQFDNFLEL